MNLNQRYTWFLIIVVTAIYVACYLGNQCIIDMLDNGKLKRSKRWIAIVVKIFTYIVNAVTFIFPLTQISETEKLINDPNIIYSVIIVFMLIDIFGSIHFCILPMKRLNEQEHQERKSIWRKYQHTETYRKLNKDHK